MTAGCGDRAVVMPPGGSSTVGVRRRQVATVLAGVRRRTVPGPKAVRGHRHSGPRGSSNVQPPRPDAGPVRKGRSPSHAPCIGRCASTVTICGLPDYRVARLRSYPIIGVAERQVAGTPRSWCQALVAPVVRAGVGLPALVPREDGGRAGNRPRSSGPAIGTRRGRQTS